MKEIHKQSLTTLKHTIFVNGVPTDASGNVTVTVDSNILGNATKTNGKVGEYTMLLPSSYNSVENIINVTWSFTVSSQNFVIEESYDVVTPYVEWIEFYSDFAGFGKTFEDYLEAEKVARYIINSYCGQSFGKREAVYEVDGSGGDALILPERLLELEDVSWYEEPNVIYVDQEIPWEQSGDGWILRKRFDYSDPSPIKSDSIRFKRNHIYFIDGLWGWNSVPAEISEAAKILVGSYVCPDITYRNRYLESIKSGDWRIQISKAAWQGTGDANVDDILKDFRSFIAFGVI